MNLIGKKNDLGMSLASVLVSIAIISVTGLFAMRGLSDYLSGKRKLAALNSSTEIEQLILSEVSSQLRELARAGCTTAAVNKLTSFSKSIGPSSTTLGTLSRIMQKTAIVIAGTSTKEQSQTAYTLATAAKDRCPGTIPTSTTVGGDFTTCFLFTPTTPSGSTKLAPNAFLASSLVFMEVTSRIIDLRNNATLKCGQVQDESTSAFKRCSLTKGASGGGSACISYQDSSYLGSGMRHTYRLYWETGPAGNKIYQSKNGVIYVPN